MSIPSHGPSSPGRQKRSEMDAWKSVTRLRRCSGAVRSGSGPTVNDGFWLSAKRSAADVQSASFVPKTLLQISVRLSMVIVGWWRLMYVWAAEAQSDALVPNTVLQNGVGLPTEMTGLLRLTNCCAA